MRQKDVDRIAGILEREMEFAHESEVEGLKQAIGAIRADVGWAQPELDMGRLDDAMNAPLLRDYGMLNPCFICKDPEDHRGRPHGEATGDGRVRADVEPDLCGLEACDLGGFCQARSGCEFGEPHIVRGED